MKKVIFALAAVVALAACSQDDVIIADKGEAIGFDTFVENSTRSKYDPSYTNANMFNDFHVYGYVNGAPLFNTDNSGNSGVKVTANGANWTYTGTQYWIAGADYNFSAVAPATNGGWEKIDTTDATKTTLSFTNNGTTDLLYAQNDTYTANTNGAPNGKVGFTFRHVLSKVKFSFENAYNASNAKIRVENVKINNAYKSGVATLNSSTAWTPSDPTLVLEFGNAAIGSATAEEAFGYETTIESYNELLMIPGQSASDYTVDGTPYNDVYEVTFDVVLLVSDQEIKTYNHTIYTTFAPVAGHSYDLKATINHENIDPTTSQEPIEFTVTTIGDWTPQSEQEI